MVIGFHGGVGVVWTGALEFVAPQLDFLLFALLCLIAVAVISLLLRRSGKAHRTLILAWGLIPVILAIGWFLVDSAGDRERERLRNRIKGMAPTYADELASLGHASLGLETRSDDPLYLRMIEKQKRWLKLNPEVADIYTFRKAPGGNALIVDSETDYNGDNDYLDEDENRTEIGEVWPEKNERLEMAFSGTEAFDDLPYTDRWGTWVSAYVPMRDKDNKVEAVLGVDFRAQEWLASISRARMAMIGFLAALVTTLLAALSMITVLRANLAERRRSEAALRQAKEAAEAATNAKSEFLANMSHEIRTPMNGILGMTDVLLSSHLTQQQRGYQELVKHSAESLLSVLNDVLDFSKIEAGKLALDRYEFLLRDSVVDALHALGFHIGERQLELVCRIEPDVPDRLVGDLGRFRQILTNLVGNALKFTEEGEILVAISLDQLREKDASLKVTVSDTGLGIPAEKKQAIFEAFTQADSATTRNYGGTGLGLTISAQLVKLMHGKIWLESEPGEGSQFHFTVRFELAGDRSDTEPPVPKQLAGLRVLVADDNATSRQILRDILTGWGIEAIVTDGGQGAIEAIEKAAESPQRTIQVAFLDRSMPGLGGEEAARHIKAKFGETAPELFLLSPADRLLEERELAALGVRGVLAKPVKASQLLEVITQSTAPSTPGRAAPAAKKAPGATSSHPPDKGRALRILLAEDGRVNQVVATRILEDGGHQVVVATNGNEVIEALRRGEFDAVLMDVQMPEMDGYQATAQIRADETKTGAHIPIIAMTANAMSEDREKCLASGMDDYLTKPVQRAELLHALEETVGAGST